MKIECNFCHKDFEKGTGHSCWCEECSIIHPMCDPCYKIHNKTGKIKDIVLYKDSITSKNRDRYT